MMTVPRPQRDTPEYDLWIAAIDIAAYAPLKHADHVWTAQIRWDDIEAMRQALDKLGIDWREVKRKNDEVRRENAKRPTP